MKKCTYSIYLVTPAIFLALSISCRALPIILMRQLVTTTQSRHETKKPICECGRDCICPIAKVGGGDFGSWTCITVNSEVGNFLPNFQIAHNPTGANL